MKLLPIYRREGGVYRIIAGNLNAPADCSIRTIIFGEYQLLNVQSYYSHYSVKFVRHRISSGNWKRVT